MTLAQIIAVAIFLVMFGVITSGKVHRYIPALIGARLVLILVFLIVIKDTGANTSVLNLAQLFQAKFWLPGQEHIESRGINWQTIVFIAGMMVMVEGLGKVAVFRWMCLVVVKLVRYQVVPILVTFMLLLGFLSIFMIASPSCYFWPR